MSTYYQSSFDSVLITRKIFTEQTHQKQPKAIFVYTNSLTGLDVHVVAETIRSPSRQLEMQSHDQNIVVATAKTRPKPAVRPRQVELGEEIMSAGSGTRIPETPVINQPNHTLQLTRPQRNTHKEAPATSTISPIDHLRIRNAIQREELRSKDREMRRTREERDNISSEVRIYRGEIQACRIETSVSRRWMEISCFGALLMLVCIVLYVLWCTVNSAEFEYQNRIIRRNLGLK